MVLLHLFLWKAPKTQVSKAPLFLGQLHWIKKKAATGDFNVTSSQKSLTASQGGSPT